MLLSHQRDLPSDLAEPAGSSTFPRFIILYFLKVWLLPDVAKLSLSPLLPPKRTVFAHLLQHVWCHA